MRKVKVAILGAGSAGLTALADIRRETDDFVMIHDGPFGTTCARVGCMPSKALIHCADQFHSRHHFRAIGIDGADQLEIDLSAVMKRVRRFRDRFTAGVQSGSTDTLRSDQLILGQGRFVAPNVIEVAGERIQAERIIIATGSRPVVPADWQSLGDKLITSDTFFELQQIPKRIAVIGLGVVGLELGQALSRLGVEVIGFEQSSHLAGLQAPETAREAVKRISKSFPIYLGEAAEVIHEDQKIKVSVSSGCFEVDAILATLGRRPNLDQIGLLQLGITLDEKGMPNFDEETMQIEDLPIFIAGDVNNRRPILHEASKDGRIAARNALAYPQVQSYPRTTLLAITFCDPQIAFFGQRYQQLQTEKTVMASFKLERNNGRAIVMDQDKGGICLFADKITQRLLGGELVMPQAEHLCHLLAWAVEQQLTVPQLLEMPFYHPVLEEAVESALKILAKQLRE